MANDHRVLPASGCYVLDKFAESQPDKVFGAFEGGASWTSRDLLHEVRGAAKALRDLGVSQGDHVLVWMPSGRDGLKTWFAANYLGAVCVPINTADRGRVLEHVVAN